MIASVTKILPRTYPETGNSGEQEVINKAQEEAQTEGYDKLDAFLETNQQEVGNVSQQQKDSKSKDEAERKKVADHLESIYSTTKSQVEAKLSGIESTVMSMDESAANSAKTNFENHVDSSMKAYKEARYTGINKALSVTDKIFGLPSEVKIFYTQARDGYVAEMDAAMVGIADYVLKSKPDSGEYLTFDIDVTAHWEKVGDSSIVSAIKEKLTEANGINDAVEKNTVLEGLVDVLSKKQDPQFITKTEYNVGNGQLRDSCGNRIGEPLEELYDKEIGEDTHLIDLIKKLYE